MASFMNIGAWAKVSPEKSLPAGPGMFPKPRLANTLIFGKPSHPRQIPIGPAPLRPLGQLRNRLAQQRHHVRGESLHGLCVIQAMLAGELPRCAHFFERQRVVGTAHPAARAAVVAAGKAMSEHDFHPGTIPNTTSTPDRAKYGRCLRHAYVFSATPPSGKVRMRSIKKPCSHGTPDGIPPAG